MDRVIYSVSGLEISVVAQHLRLLWDRAGMCSAVILENSCNLYRRLTFIKLPFSTLIKILVPQHFHMIALSFSDSFRMNLLLIKTVRLGSIVKKVSTIKPGKAWQ